MTNPPVALGKGVNVKVGSSVLVEGTLRVEFGTIKVASSKFGVRLMLGVGVGVLVGPRVGLGVMVGVLVGRGVGVREGVKVAVADGVRLGVGE